MKGHPGYWIIVYDILLSANLIQIQICIPEINYMYKYIPKILRHIGHWLDMVYLPPRGNFVDHIFLEAQCLARILQHVSPLTMAALSCNSLLHTLPYKYLIIEILLKTSEKVQKIR